MRLTPGTRVGPYEVVALLGAGGMAEVYRAKDTRLGRDVAIKVVSEALGGDGAFLERFDREAKLAASLAHPNVVALHDVGFHDGKPYFVTELLQGESLRQRLVKGPIPLAKALAWAAQMAQGLAAAHERGIVHRDLKPENVFITRDGHLKLLDFGIAKLVEAAQVATPHGLMDETVSPSGGHTRTGAVVGTPGYMSPEQVHGDAVDERTDIFSLGAVLYEMLCGRRAFPAGPIVESGYAILHNEPELLSSAVPPLVAQVVHRCLEKDAGRRFQSARDLAFNLEILRTPTGSAAPTATVAKVPASTSRGRRWLWPLAGGLAALGIASTIYLVRRELPQRAPSVEQITFRQGRVSAGRFNPEGRVVFSAAWDGQPLEVFARAPGSPDAQSLGLRDISLFGVSATGELAVSLHPFVSVDGGERGTLAVVSGAGGTPRALAENVVFADWSANGELAAVRVSAGKVQLEFPLGVPLFETAGIILNPRVSPSGDGVAFFHNPRSLPQELMVVDRGGRARTLYTLSRAEFGRGLAWVPSGDEVWFTSHDAIWASPLSGGRRLVYQGVSNIHLEDIRRGEVLVNIQEARREVALVPPEQQPERRLSLWERTNLSALSDDGRQVLYTSSPGQEPFTYLRATDGSPALRLGTGYAVALSPDEKWVIARPDDYRNGLSLLPVGPGASKTVSVSGLMAFNARWLQDGLRIALIGLSLGDKHFHLYKASFEGGVPAPISDAVVSPYYIEVSRDDRLVAAKDVEDVVTLYPLEGGAPIPLRELGKDVVPVGWNADGQLWLKEIRGVPSRILRYDVRKRRVVEERTVSPSDLTGVTGIRWVRITPDGRSMAFDYERILGHLSLLDGLAPTGR